MANFTDKIQGKWVGREEEDLGERLTVVLRLTRCWTRSSLLLSSGATKGLESEVRMDMIHNSV